MQQDIRVFNPAWLNGEVCQQSLIHDRGLMYGDGFFTTILCYQQRLLNWSAHWQRLASSAQRLGFPELDQHTILSYLSPAVAASKNLAVIKLVVTRGLGAGYAPPSNAHQSDLRFITVMSSAPQGLEQQINAVLTDQPVISGLEVIQCKTPISINARLAGLKHLNRLDNVLARDEVVKAAVDEGLMLDSDGHVICATQSNVIVIKGRKLITPKLDRAGVEGTCLARLPSVIEHAGLNYSWLVADLSIEDVKQADAVIFCNAVRGIQAMSRFQENGYNIELVTPIHQAWWKSMITR